MQKINAGLALTPSGWVDNLSLTIGEDGRISEITELEPGATIDVGVLLPANANLHSHAFQRAMAGLTERRGPDKSDSFWTWRKLMYQFLDALNPDQVEAIAAFVQMEMLEAGYASVGEFHYVHHQTAGRPYDDIAELSNRIFAAAGKTGIGLTHLPVLYQQGGCDGRPLEGGQQRFGNSAEAYQQLWDKSASAIRALPDDTVLGVAGHSLRAVSPESLEFAISLAGDGPFHIHVAEQVAEVEEILAAWNARPIEWLLKNHELGKNWCLIHCTQMAPDETRGLAKTGAVVGLCPITESSLGDGIFDGMNYLDAVGKIGIGSDSNIRISVSEELRTLEYSQRLRDRGRAMFATSQKSTGRRLYEATVAGSVQAIARDAGSIEVGKLVDLVALDANSIHLANRSGDEILDSWIFAANDELVTDVWSAGRHVVREGKHKHHEAITQAYRKVLGQLVDAL